MKDNVRKRIDELRKQINYHSRKYYIEDNPEISDYEFDQLMKELEELEDRHPDLITPNSPTQRVGGEPAEQFETVQHRSAMLSLDNTYSPEELLEFDKRVRKLIPEQEIEYVAELKLDGLGIALVYEEGRFTRGATRGDGATGEDVTSNLRTIRTIPLVIENQLPVMEVRGEVYMRRKAFQKLNQEREENDENLFANPRNAAAGSVRLLDPRITASRPLEIFVYALTYAEGANFSTHYESLQFLKDSGLKINPHTKKFGSIEEVLKYCEEWTERREDIDYEIDGVVIKVNSLAQQTELGSTNKSPRWAISYKFPARRATTKIEDIIIQVGRTGSLTPVAVLTPVSLSGIVIARATLHNEDEIKRKDIRIGDTVIVERAGDVIPAVVMVLEEKRTGEEKEFTMPETCPVCGSDVFKPENEAVSRCTNPECPAQIKENLHHFASRNAMDIEGLGPSLIDQLVKKDMVHNSADLYYLQKEQLAQLERMGDKSAQNLMDELEKSKDNSLSRFIFALGIRHVGTRAADILAERYSSIDELTKATTEELQEIDEIGPRIAESVEQFFQQERTKRMLDKFRNAGIKMQEEKSYHESSQPLNGKNFVLTGSLESMTRDEASQYIKDAGGKVSSSVSKNTDYVVVGESPGSKYDKAQKLGITILDEEEFLKLMDSKEK
ncbi:NAD-dependent DNA ligase LigA [Candidatus Poribacteria bacterium]|nr:NAD-dependent DNA ligase LigA [Candidatus Poribacteria bacterium]